MKTEFREGAPHTTRVRHAARVDHAAHADGEFHHHHSHAAGSHHEGGRHLLSIEHLSVAFDMYDPDSPWLSGRRRLAPVLTDVALSVHAGEVLAVVGASGSGKTVLAGTVLGLFEPNARVEGSIWFQGERRDASGLASLRGAGVALAPQSVDNLDPLMRVGEQILGPRGPRRRARERRLPGLLSAYGLAPEVARLYPHELSGGMARRALLISALVDDPALIIADEPTPGLDMELAVRALDDLRAFARAGGGVMLITHDIELALRVADRVAVMDAGTVVEETAVASFAAPELLRHPFSRALWHALPEHDFAVPGAHDVAEPGALAEQKANTDPDAAATAVSRMDALRTSGEEPR